jgi:hypothetical protein
VTLACRCRGVRALQKVTNKKERGSKEKILVDRTFGIRYRELGR